MLCKRGLFSALLFLITTTLFGQVTASFTADFTEGCVSTGLQVQFTNTSTGATSYLWDLGKGNSTVSVVNPAETYTAAGVYTVIVTATDGANSDVFTLDITIHEDPEAAFSIVGDSTGCPDFSVSFIDESVGLEGSIVSWSWSNIPGSNFTNSIQNPSEVYTQTGTYDIKLIVVDTFGCSNAITIVDQVIVVDPPVVDFVGAPILACTPPLDVTFTNNSTPNLIYTWDYAIATSNTTSTADTTVTYSSTGIYDVALTVTDPFGCSSYDTIVEYVVIEDVFATFQMNQPVGCPGVLSSFPTTGTLGASSYMWDYGDGSGANPGGSPGSHNFAAPGSYDVSLTVTSSSAMCSDDTTITIVIEDFTAAFTPSGLYSCVAPFSVTFTDVSQSNAAGWQWEFGDGSGTSNLQNPVYEYQDEGTYLITLTAVSSNGCIDDTVLVDTIKISLPVADFTISYEDNVCFPTVVTLTDNGSTPDSTGTLSQWQWDFGNGSAVITNTTSAIVTMTFTEAGEFEAILTVTTSPNGCIDTLRLVVEIGTYLGPKDTVWSPNDSPDTSCAIDMVNFDGYVDSVHLADSWEWFGTGGLSGTGQNYQHQYTDVSAVNVWNTDTLVVEYNGCFDTLYTDSIYILGPIVESINALRACNNPFDRTFSAVYIDTTTYQWSFGDGDTITSYGNIGTVPAGIHGFDPIKAVDSTRGQFNNPTHTYAEEGDYIVSIVGWNQGSFDADNVFYPDSCAYLSTLEVKIRDSVTTFSATQFGCPQQPILFEIDSLFPLDVGDIFFTWNFGDNTPDTTNNNISISHSFPSVGDYYITLTFIDINGCSFERVDTLTIINPTAIFSMDTNQICVGDTIYFTDLTISDTAIATWSWNFDDGGVSIAKDTSYAFNAKGNYDVQLIVVDSVGCTSSVINSVTVIEPKVIFSADSLQLCAGESTNFTDDSQPYSGSFEIVAWQWDFGNDSTSTLQNPTNTYIADGTYNVALTVTDNQGCVHSDTNKLYIDVQAIPVADFFADVTKMCYDYVDMNSVVFTDISLSDDVTIRWWDFNESGYSLDDSIVYTGAAIYEDPDTFDVSLIVITDYGCRDTLTKQDYIIVIRPEATFSVSPDTICNRDSVLFTITSSSNVDNFSWTFGDGEGNPNADSTTWHMYDTPQSQYVVPGVKLESNELAVACFYTQEQDSIYVHHINADFSLTPISGCVPIEVTFFNASTGNTLAYNWNFDDGSASSSQTNPIYTYDTAGTYNITLTITETMTDEGVSIGCTDDAVKSVVVFPLPAVTVTKGLQVCIGESETLWAISDDTTNSYTYQWSPSTWLNGTTSSTVTLTPQSDQVYTLLVSNNFNCTITESIAVTTFGVTTIDLISDTSSKTIFIGDSLDLSILDTNEVLVDDALYNFVWSPTNYIDCADCNFTEFTGLVTTLYDITVTDIGGICPPQFETIKIIVRNEFAFDLPDLFTPNDDGINDIVYVRGYGIKELQVFEIYNRWGEKVFENTENDLTIGWDGTFNGQPQNMDTYIAVAVVENYHGKTFTIKKHLTLYR